MEVLVKLFFCVLKVNRLKMLSLYDKEYFMNDIRYEIIPGSFKNQHCLDQLLLELNKQLTIDEIWVH